MIRYTLKALIATLAGLAPLAHADDVAATGTLEITLTDLQPKGTVRLAVFDSEQAYEEGGPVVGREIPVTAETASVVIEGLAPGSYAIKLYHDVNDNGDMDANPFGMPTEPYAFSNNAKGNFGPAKWDKAVFEITADGAVQTLSVK